MGQSNSQIKVQLAGNANSGQTTWLKQLAIIYKQGFTEMEREYLKMRLVQQYIKDTQQLLQKLQNIPEQLQVAVQQINALDIQQPIKLTEQILQYVNQVVNFSDFIQLQKENNYEYFSARLPKLLEKLPNDEDILKAHISLEAEDFSVKINGIKYDFSKTQNQRDVLLYFISAIDFSNIDENVEQLKQFVNSKAIRKTPVIVLVTKTDLVEQQLKYQQEKRFAGKEEVLKCFNQKITNANLVNQQIRHFSIVETNQINTQLMGDIVKKITQIELQNAVKDGGFI